MNGVLSSGPLAALLGQQHDIIAVVMPGVEEQGRLPVMQPDGKQTTADLARAAGIPLLTMHGAGDAALAEQLRSLEADIILVSCFPYQLPRSIYSGASQGSYNLHPSLLPCYRGPDPLFWQFRDGVTDSGITLHRLADTIDSGDIVLQVPVTLTTGMSGREAEARMAEAGSELVLRALAALAGGPLDGTAQDEQQASYYPLPTENDYALEPQWSARHAWHFIRGTRHRGQRYCYESDAETVCIDDATAYTDDGVLQQPVERAGNTLMLQFTPGVVQGTASRNQ